MFYYTVLIAPILTSLIISISNHLYSQIMNINSDNFNNLYKYMDYYLEEIMKYFYKN